jgi:hypothetical protein
LAHAALACSVPEPEHHRDVRVIDRVTADARPQPTRPGPVDSGAADGASAIDARDYYCNVPEPGPCCCDPLVLELRRPETDARASYTCEFAIERSDKRRPVDTRKINLVAIDASGDQTTLRLVDECSEDAPGWLIEAGDPPIGRLCPVSCQAMVSGEYVALQLIEGCYTIACSPP